MQTETKFMLLVVFVICAIVGAVLYASHQKAECMKVMKDRPIAEIQMLCRF